jgi:hypothetical protein
MITEAKTATRVPLICIEPKYFLMQALINQKVINQNPFPKTLIEVLLNHTKENDQFGL